MNSNRSLLSALFLPCTLLAACTQARSPAASTVPAPPSAAPTTAVASATPSSTLPAAAAAARVSCAADASWVDQPSFPPEVPNQEQSLCNFQQLAWRDFLALVQPDPKPSPSQSVPPQSSPTSLLYEGWMSKEGVFRPEQYQKGRKIPFAWGETPPVPEECRALAATSALKKKVRLMGLIRPRAGGFSGEIQEAGSNTAPIIDQKGNLVFYEQRMNKTQYDYLVGCGLFAKTCFDSMGTEKPNLTSIEFPDQSIEIKTSWRVVSDAEKDRYYTVDVFVEPTSPSNPGCSVRTLGLVGFHIVHKTPNHPESIWATFAHEDNAPTCDAPTAKSPSGADWSFYNAGCDATKCPPNLFQNPCGKVACQPCTGTSNIRCLSTFKCGGDLAHDCETVGSCLSTANSCTNNCYDPKCGYGTPIQACQTFPTGFGGKGVIDGSIQALNDSVHALTTLPPVWRHYNLIGTVWFDGAPPVKVHHASSGDADNPLAGSLMLSNITMETYNQGLERGCFKCHGGSYAKSGSNFPQADFSHLFSQMSIAGSGACKVDPTYQGVCPKPPNKAN